MSIFAFGRKKKEDDGVYIAPPLLDIPSPPPVTPGTYGIVIDSTHYGHHSMFIDSYNTEVEQFSMFTQKHYKVLARMLRGSTKKLIEKLPPEEHALALKAYSVVVTEMLDTLARDNPRFKREEFLKALAGGGIDEKAEGEEKALEAMVEFGMKVLKP